MAQVLLLERTHQTLPWTKVVTAPFSLPGSMPIRGYNVLALPKVTLWQMALTCSTLMLVPEGVQPSSPCQSLNGLSTIHTTAGMYIPCLWLHPPCPAGLGQLDIHGYIISA